MHARPHYALLLLTLAGFGSLYTPQPLLPDLAAVFDLGEAQVSLLISIAMLPLAIAPLAYGYLLEGVPVQRMLVAATLGLALCQTGLSLATEWWQLVALRGTEGLLLPALFTALMTAISSEAPQGRVREAMAWYIATTILGGFGGRALSGLLAEGFGWRAAFAIWAGCVVLALWISLRHPVRASGHFDRPHPRIFREIMALAPYRFAYQAIFFVFFVFAGFLNVLPFRLRDLAPELGSGLIGLAYTGYLIGVAVTLGGAWLSRRAGSEARLMSLGIGFYLAALLCFTPPAELALFLGMPVFCAGMFLIHGRLSGHVNQLADRYRGIVNGIYIAVYYFGGSLGSWLVPLAYKVWGWHAMLLLLATGMLAAALSLGGMLRAGHPPATRH
jgi:MFS transporter, YNFM family, putative membrane transport protein